MLGLLISIFTLFELALFLFIIVFVITSVFLLLDIFSWLTLLLLFDLLGNSLGRLIIFSILSLLFEFEVIEHGVLLLGHLRAVERLSSLDPPVLIHALAVEQDEAHDCAVVVFVYFPTHFPQIKREYLVACVAVLLLPSLFFEPAQHFVVNRRWLRLS